jgi:cell division protein FtsL
VSATPQRLLPRDPSPDAQWARPARGHPAQGRPAGPHLEAVPDGAWLRRRMRLRRRVLALTGLLLALVPVFGLVLVHVDLTKNEERLTSLQRRVTAAQQQNVRLRLEVAQLGSPGRVVSRAQALGMVPPPSVLYLTAVPDGTATATPAPGPAPTTPAASIAGLAATKRADRTP